MPSTLDIITITYTDTVDDYGYPVREEAESVESYPCRLSSLSGEEQIIAGRLAATVTASLTCPHDAPLAPDKSIRVDGRDYGVVHVEFRSPGLSPHLKALVSRAS